MMLAALASAEARASARYRHIKQSGLATTPPPFFIPFFGLGSGPLRRLALRRPTFSAACRLRQPPKRRLGNGSRPEEQ